MTLTILLYIVFITWVVMLLRVIIGFVSSDLFIIRQTIARKSKKRTHLPTVTVLIPAYNEENVIVRALASVRASNYPAKKLEVIVINDGSTDNTENVIKAFKKAHKVGCKIRLLNRPNGGKAKALNYALKKSVRTSLVMCLDADSFLHRDALRNAVQYFRDRKVIALSTNVNVVEDGTLIGLAQRIEYLMGFHIKKGITLLGINYIIGGAGSMFRYSMLKRAGYYEGNTLTEDLDVTLKIFRAKRRDEKIAYAHDAITFTEAVHSLRALMRQRYRWMYGRVQVFAKHSDFFFIRNRQYSRRITWFVLPYAVVQDITFLFAPVVVVYLLYFALRFGDLGLLTSGIAAIALYLSISIWSAEALKLKDKVRLTYYAAPMYVLIYLTTFADYYALTATLLRTYKIKRSLTQKHTTWRSPERKVASVSI